MDAFKKFKDQLICSFCLDTYTSPKQLQCNHVFCQKCLVRYVKRLHEKQPSVTCPDCGQATPIPPDGVAGIQIAVEASKFADIVEEHKKTEVDCPQRQTSGEMICGKCITEEVKQYSSSNSHDSKEPSRAYEKCEEEMSSLLEPIEKQLTSTEKALMELSALHSEISAHQTVVEMDIHNSIKRLHETLTAREAELIKQVKQLTQEKLKSLEKQKGQVETTQARLESCLLFLKEHIISTPADERNVWLMESNMVGKVKNLAEVFPPDGYKPCTQADVTFSVLTDLETECRNYGTVYSSGPPDLSKCCITEKRPEIATVGWKCSTILETLNTDSKPCEVPTTSISCELVSEITGSKVKGSIKRKGQGKYEITYQPRVKGRHQLHITVGAQHTKGSPHSIATRPLLSQMSYSFETIHGTHQPWGIALSQQGDIVVTEANGQVSVFNPGGDKLQSFGTQGSGEGQFSTPRGVAIDEKGNIFVADEDNHRIQKFTSQGEFLVLCCINDDKDLKPCGIAYNPMNGKLYVICRNGQMLIFHPDLKRSKTFEKLHNTDELFGLPYDIACDCTGNVYTTDYHNNDITVFTAEGKLVRKFGGDGGGLHMPWGIAVDSRDRVYVSEIGNGRVSVFTYLGYYLTSFRCCPAGVAVDSCGVVYVCNNSCIKLF